MDENQHKLVKTDRNFDASPAVTTEMCQDPYFGPKRRVSGSIQPSVLEPGHAAHLYKTIRTPTVKDC